MRNVFIDNAGVYSENFNGITQFINARTLKLQNFTFIWCFNPEPWNPTLKSLITFTLDPEAEILLDDIKVIDSSLINMNVLAS